MSDLAVDDHLRRNLNLLAGSPTFAMSVKQDGSATLSNPPDIPAGSGQWLIHGLSHLPDGSTVVSAFQIDTNGGGDTVMHTWWQTPKGWCSTSDQPRIFERMDRRRADLFPCRFETTIALGPGISPV